MIEITLPEPPSWNALYRIGLKRVYKSREYTNWIQRAVAWGMAQKVPAIEGYVAVEYIVPQNRRRDLDNYLKPLNDCLQTIGVLANDQQIRRITIQEEPRADVSVVITQMTGKRRAA